MLRVERGLEVNLSYHTLNLLYRRQGSFYNNSGYETFMDVVVRKSSLSPFFV